MNTQEVYVVVNASPWNYLVPLYIFFKGLSVGALCISALYTVFRSERFKSLAFPAALTSLLAFIPVPFLLLADLHQPLRFWHLLVNFNPTSVISWGTWLIILYPLCLLWYIARLGMSQGISIPVLKGVQESASTSQSTSGLGLSGLSILTLSLALLADLYTAFLLGVVKGKVLWNSALLPGYFLTSAIVTGAALVLIVYLNKKPEEKTVRTLVRIIQGALALEIFFAISQWITLGATSLQGQKALEILWKDPMYLIGDIFLGILVPLVLLNKPSLNKKPVLMISALLVILGGLLLRFSIVGVGIQAAALWN
ncbi:NrfD/PsrC family molybdoenzyme membrane anchor subunit [Desulfosporosinus metallidurans]|uniref:Tetrathionate reductase subunit C n=1 Tax=Desulfosporosinus metallidurans TaxID=1888891 RepID=A0A1Q8R013_9FIRM|nr:NrfD/PsrC family molybdoenzyme membrane anchor subunit [Desulfosporosinus metallidurans]OLN32953.1 Tetrathionate reductase subunit C [Desulfosporosinus metallidurans]